MSATVKDPTLSIIIVNYNGETFIEDCIDSILSADVSFLYEVIVIDNHSQDQSLSKLAVYGDRITVVPQSQNLGFAKANNLGVSLSAGKYILLLNNDTIICDNSLQMMVDYYVENPEIGLLAPCLLNKDGSIQTHGSSLVSWKYKRQKVQSMSFVCGAAMMMHKVLWDELDGFDENFVFYNEDLDLCQRIRKKGHVIIYHPFIKITHLGGVSTRSRPVGAMKEGFQGSLYFCRKTYSVWIYTMYRFLMLLGMVILYGVASIKRIWNPQARQYAQMYRDMIDIIIRNAVPQCSK